MLNRCHVGNCRHLMRDWIRDGVKVQTVVTSPPYWGLRNYNDTKGQLGLERTPQRYLARMRGVFRLVRDLLAEDGTLWLNMGDSYATSAGKVGDSPGGGAQGAKWQGLNTSPNRMPISGLKPKDMVGMPWMLALLLRADGWYLRQDIVWSKPAPMPESVTDRCTKSHEYLFLLTKSKRYYFDQAAISEPIESNRPDMATKGVRTGLAYLGQQVGPQHNSWKTPDGWDTSTGEGGHGSFHREGREKGQVRTDKDQGRGEQGLRDSTKFGRGAGWRDKPGTSPPRRNKRSVWTVQTEPYPEAHFATYPQKLIEPCVLAGSRPGDVVFDPFMGSGTTAAVAEHLGRKWLGCELVPEYLELQRDRLRQQCLEL